MCKNIYISIKTIYMCKYFYKKYIFLKKLYIHMLKNIYIFLEKLYLYIYMCKYLYKKNKYMCNANIYIKYKYICSKLRDIYIYIIIYIKNLMRYIYIYFDC